MKKSAYIIFSRIPISGKTKTRLMPFLTGDECSTLHKMFLKDLFNMCKNLKDSVDIFLSYSDEGDPLELLSLCPNFIKSFKQVGQNIGDRMSNSINHLLNIGYEKVILTGCDIPNISKSIIINSLQLLNTDDIVIGPTTDGGYYLIGSTSSIENILTIPTDWGHINVFENTLKTITSFNKTYALSDKLSDIDTIDDLLKFNNNNVFMHTTKFAKTLNLEERIKNG